MYKVFLTGATGVMGMAGLRSLQAARRSGKKYEITVLARPSKRNEKKLAPFIAEGVKVIWGDLMNAADVGRGVDWADIVLHVGGMVSPMADWYPEKTYEVNVGAMRNIIEAAERKEARGERVRVVYIGSVSQYGPRMAPYHWGRCGDPISVATFDSYALSKSVAERLLAESKLSRWVSLRQTGIMHPALLTKASDPIAFHVPIDGCLEWATDEESGRLLESVCSLEGDADDGPFWCRFYNIGGGESYRLSNYDFIQLTLKVTGCPKAEKVFDRNWFATGNFHGIWYLDSDLLEQLVPYREGENFQDYMAAVMEKMPFYFKLAPLAPAFLIKWFMKRVARTEKLGPLNWIETHNEPRLYAAFGGMEKWREIPGWEEGGKPELPAERKLMDHGYDESKPESEFTLADMQQAARWRGGKCVSESMQKGDFDTPLEWECSEGHRFKMKPRTMLRGGHWCGKCLEEIARDPRARERLAAKSPFLAQTLEK